jgi:hypothetical protein
MALFRAWQGRLPGEKPSNGRIVVHPYAQHEYGSKGFKCVWFLLSFS